MRDGTVSQIHPPRMPLMGTNTKTTNWQGPRPNHLRKLAIYQPKTIPDSTPRGENKTTKLVWDGWVGFGGLRSFSFRIFLFSLRTLFFSDSLSLSFVRSFCFFLCISVGGVRWHTIIPVLQSNIKPSIYLLYLHCLSIYNTTSPVSRGYLRWYLSNSLTFTKLLGSLGTLIGH